MNLETYIVKTNSFLIKSIHIFRIIIKFKHYSKFYYKCDWKHIYEMWNERNKRNVLAANPRDYVCGLGVSYCELLGISLYQ